MKTDKLLLIKGLLIVIITVLLPSCEREPYVTRSETVEVYNSSLDVVNEVDKNYGYNFKYKPNYANPYYKYVIYDDDVKCPVVKSSSPVFKTGSDNPNGPIHKNDICIDCGHKWIEHKRW